MQYLAVTLSGYLSWVVQNAGFLIVQGRMKTSLTSYGGAPHYTWPWTSVCLVHAEVADFEAISTPSVPLC